MPKKLPLGISAQCTVNVKYPHPAKIIYETYTNKTAHTIVENLLVIKQDTRVANKRQQYVVIFRHDAFNMAEVYCMKRWEKVTNEGSKEHFFERNETTDDTEGAGAYTEESSPIDSTIVHSGNHYDDIAMVILQGLMAENNNDPAPENIPDGTTTKSSTPNVKW